MTIETQTLRDLIRRAVPLPWTLATSNSWRRISSRDGVTVCSPCTQSDGHPDLAFPGGPEGPTAQLLIEAANALPDLLDIFDAANEQVAEYARLAEQTSAEADARIDAQEAEIARLREALSSVLADLEMRAEDGVMDISQGALDKARATLSGESNG